MKNNRKNMFTYGFALLAGFVLWTILILTVDVKPIGVNDTLVGFSSLNIMFHHFTGVHISLYNITDWLGLVPIFVCCLFAFIGLSQLIKRKSIFKVDLDIIILGIYYIIVIIGYLLFEMFPINYRPVLINGCMEASYPSSTTLLVLSVMPTLSFQINRRFKNISVKKIINIFVILFSIFMVFGRIVSGVHWISDIIGSMMLSSGLFYLYKGLVFLCERDNDQFGG